MSTNTESAHLPRCPQCSEPVRPGTAFCGNCGASVSGITHARPADDANDPEATSAFVPVTTGVNDSDQSPASEQSPWAPPASREYASSTAVSPVMANQSAAEANDLFAIDTGTAQDFLTPKAQSSQPESIRGLILGTLAAILIAAVFALYLYDAWLSESAQSTVEGWYPW